MPFIMLFYRRWLFLQGMITMGYQKGMKLIHKSAQVDDYFEIYKTEVLIDSLKFLYIKWRHCILKQTQGSY